MKTSKKIQIALVAAMMSVATVANAQTFSGTGTAVDSVAATQVDWVTVGATMPYSASADETAFTAWKAAFTAAGFTNPVTATTKWFTTPAASGTPAEITAARNEAAILLTWSATGAFTLTTEASLIIDGVTGSCATATTDKKVYVLPNPTAAFVTTNQILGCNVTSFDVKYKVTGVGERALDYTVTRRPYLGPETSADQDLEAGTKVTNEADFSESVSFANAEKMYTINDVPEQTFSVTDLEPGYIYTLTFKTVSDQISRKSDVAATDLTDVKVTLAVVPRPEGTQINHKSNIVD